MNNKLNKGGFTLIELLVVVLIIGILSSIALPQYTKAVEKARAAEAMVWLNNFVTAETVYFLARGKFGDLDELDINLGSFSSNLMKNFDLSETTIGTVSGKPTAIAKLTRKDNPSMAYSLKVTMTHAANDDKITTVRQCTIASGGNGKICQAITNGRSCGVGAETTWCYSNYTVTIG